MGSHAGGSGISGIDTVRLGHDINRIKQLFGYEQVTKWIANIRLIYEQIVKRMILSA